MGYLLDTNICIYLCKGYPIEVITRFDQLVACDLFISTITLAELRQGIGKMNDTEKRSADLVLQAFLDDVVVLPFDHAAARMYGILAALLPDRRRNAMDKLIAAHALSLELTVVTNNEADFVIYPGLQVENWVNSIH